MLTSLPTLFTPSPHTLWYPSLTAAPPPPPPSQPHPPSTPDPHQHPHPHNHRTNPNLPPRRTLLSTLRADETKILHRKANIRRFGAGWLRPPGLGKTLQGMADERAEREEGEIARAREYAVAEAQAQADADAADADVVPVEGVGDEGEGERDLDEEVPDAEGEVGWSDADEEEEDEEEEEEEEEEEGLEGAEQTLLEHGELEEGVDLDAEVPGAEEGSYEHTDTEVEDESSDDGGGPVRGTFGTSRPGMVLGTNGRGVLGSSAYGSSPVRMARRRSSGRGRGREN